MIIEKASEPASVVLHFGIAWFGHGIFTQIGNVHRAVGNSLKWRMTGFLLRNGQF